MIAHLPSTASALPPGLVLVLGAIGIVVLRALIAVGRAFTGKATA